MVTKKELMTFLFDIALANRSDDRGHSWEDQELWLRDFILPVPVGMTNAQAMAFIIANVSIIQSSALKTVRIRMEKATYSGNHLFYIAETVTKTGLYIVWNQGMPFADRQSAIAEIFEVFKLKMVIPEPTIGQTKITLIEG